MLVSNGIFNYLGFECVRKYLYLEIIKKCFSVWWVNGLWYIRVEIIYIVVKVRKGIIGLKEIEEIEILLNERGYERVFYRFG